MANQWYYAKQGERVGPVSEEQLKQLASSGQLQPTDPIWSEGMPKWIRANEVPNLFPTPDLSPPPLSLEGARVGDRTRQAIQRAEEQTERIAGVFWFLDLKFSQFFTPKLIGAVWTITICVLCVSSAASIIWFLWKLPVLQAAGASIAQLLATMVAMVFARVFYELFLVVFRIAERMGSLNHLEYLKHLENIGK